MRTHRLASKVLLVPVVALLVGCSTVEVLRPASGSTFQAGQTVEFEGRVTRSSQTGGADRSDDLEWASSLDGNLGTGRTVDSSSLSVGNHTVTATWPSGNRDDSIQIQIVP